MKRLSNKAIYIDLYGTLGNFRKGPDVMYELGEEIERGFSWHTYGQTIKYLLSPILDLHLENRHIWSNVETPTIVPVLR